MTELLLAMAALLLAAAVLFLLLPLAARPAMSSKQVTRGAKELLRRTGALVAGRVPSRMRTRLERQIQMAGGLLGLTAEGFVSYAIAAVGLALVLALGAWVAGAPAVVSGALVAIALVLPEAWLLDRVKTRHNDILRQMPFHLDLLTLGVEAGLDFTAALNKMVEKAKPGPLREEFQLMMSQIRVGTPRAQALRDMAERVNLPQLSAFLGALLQADKLGMSIGKVLRIQSDSVRIERSQRAEQRANEAPVKILIPLVAFVFPTIWIILAGPLLFTWLF